MKEEYFENLRRVLLEFEVILGCSSMTIMLIIFLQTSFNQLSTYHITLWMQWESKALPGLALTHFLASSLLLPCGLSHTHIPPTPELCCQPPGLTLPYFLASPLLLPCGFSLSLTHTHTRTTYPPTLPCLNSALSPHQVQNLGRSLASIADTTRKREGCFLQASLQPLKVYLPWICLWSSSKWESLTNLFWDLYRVREIIWCSGELLHIKNQRPNYINQSFLNFSFPVCWMRDMMLYRKAFEKHEGLCKK